MQTNLTPTNYYTCPWCGTEFHVVVSNRKDWDAVMRLHDKECKWGIPKVERTTKNGGRDEHKNRMV